MYELKTIKKHWEFGPLDSGEIAWLIKEVEELTKINRELNFEIGKYSQIIFNIAEKNGNLTKELETLANGMLSE